MIASTQRRPPGRATTVVTLIIEGLGVLMQLLLVYGGLNYIFFGGETEDDQNLRLLLWCLIATLYLAGTVLWLNIDVRVRDDDGVMRTVSSTAVVRWFSTIVTFSSSLVGLAAATTLILSRGEPEHLSAYELIAVWAMLVSWAMFHWGYARIYYSRYHHPKGETPLRFPGTERPRLVDFVYFSFTNGTSFAPADVSILTTRMRWTVVWHTTFSFFFNALIIVLTMNTISGGFHAG